MGSNLNYPVPLLGDPGPGWASKIIQALTNVDAASAVSGNAYDMLGDGVFDNTVAFAATATAAGPNGLITLNPGVYRLTEMPPLRSLGISLICAGPGAVTFDYWGNSAALDLRIDTFDIGQAGTIGGFTIDGTNAGDDATGAIFGDVVGLGLGPIVVANFDGAAQRGIVFHNTTGWTERTWSAGPLRTRNCRVHYQFTKDGGGNASIAYNEFRLQFDLFPGQTMFQTMTGVYLGDCRLIIHGNADGTVDGSGAGTVFDIQAGSNVVRPDCLITVEQTNGTGTKAFSTGSAFAGYTGKVFFNNFPAADSNNAVMTNFEGSGNDAILGTVVADQIPQALSSFGQVIGPAIRGFFVCFANLGEGNSFAVLAKNAFDDLADAVEVARLDGNGLTFLNDPAKRLGWSPNGVLAPGKILATGGLGSGGAVSATTPGSVVKKLPIYDDGGALLGWLPVYSSIT